MATHSCILAWKIPWTEEPGRLQSKDLDTTEQLTYYPSIKVRQSYILKYRYIKIYTKYRPITQKNIHVKILSKMTKPNHTAYLNAHTPLPSKI